MEIPDLTRMSSDSRISVSLDQDKADLAEYFSSVFTPEDSPNPDTLTINHVDIKLQMPQPIITKCDILDYFKRVKTTTSPGPDGLHPKFLKEIIVSIADPLQLLFNRFLHESYVLSDWKVANIRAIYKKGNKSLPENYRPISLTSILSKWLETIVKTYRTTYAKQSI